MLVVLFVFRKVVCILVGGVVSVTLCVAEAKDNNHAVGAGMQQALGYAETLDVPFAFSSNGDGFLMHDRSGLSGKAERELTLNKFPSPGELWTKYRQWKSLDDDQERV